MSNEANTTVDLPTGAAAPTVACVWFNRNDSNVRYEQMAEVWRYSARRVFGDSVHLHCFGIDPPDYTEDVPMFYRGDRKIGPSKTISWREKIRWWNSVVQAAPGPVLMTDVDVAFYSNPFPELPADMDVGLCGGNTGAVYFADTTRAQDFMERWRQVTELLVYEPRLYKRYDAKYKGLDQASMGYLLESGEHDANVLKLPRRFHSTCQDYELPCHIMHYHSRMRAVVFGDASQLEIDWQIRSYADAWWRMLEEVRG